GQVEIEPEECEDADCKKHVVNHRHDRAERELPLKAEPHIDKNYKVCEDKSPNRGVDQLLRNGAADLLAPELLAARRYRRKHLIRSRFLRVRSAGLLGKADQNLIGLSKG